MSDLRSQLERLRDRLPPPSGAFERLARYRAKKKRRERVVAAVVALGVAGSGVVFLVLAFAGRSTLPAQQPGIEASEATNEHSSEEHGYRVTYPETWALAEEQLMPMLADPYEILSIGTYELRPGGECVQYPTNAIEDLGPHDALISLLEDGNADPSRFPARPGQFSPNAATGTDESAACGSPPAGFVRHWIPFTDRGRGFYAYVAFGRDASGETRREAWQILDSLRFDRR